MEENYEDYMDQEYYETPNLVKINSLKVNVSDAVNDNPTFLSDTQYLVVGQYQYTNVSCNMFNMIVDNEGVLVNAPLTMRTELADRYALAVDGNVYISGELVVASCNVSKQDYDPLGLFDCASSTSINVGTLVEIVGYSNNIIQVQPSQTAFNSALFGVCTYSVLGDSFATGGAGGSNAWGGDAFGCQWKTQVQTAGIALINCSGPINVGDLITSTSSGFGQQTTINGFMIDTAFHNYTVAKAMQSVPSGSTAIIRCLMNATKAPAINRGDGYWVMGCNESENIFYPGNMTIGGDYAARSNMYSMNIVKSADRTIDHSQFNMENTQTSQFKMAIVGTGVSSPAIISSGPVTAIEFHAGRQQEYFERMYTTSNWIPTYGLNDGVYDTSLVVQPAEVPDYVNNASPLDAPHLLINTDGNVGIHTSCNVPLSFHVRTTPNMSGQFPTITESMALHVQGSTFSSNMLIWDYESGMAKNIDDLYVRQLGVSFPASNVIPGPFSENGGGYYFPTHLGVEGIWDSNYALKVWDDSSFASNVYIDNTLIVENIDCANASFQNDVTVLSDVVIAGSIRLEGGIFVSVLDGEDIYGTKHYTWQAVNFDVASSASNQFNQVGQGFTTPGRLGIGVAARDYEAQNSIRSQFVINKRDPNSSANLWEVEIKDLTTSRFTPVGWIGHPFRPNSIRGDDASLVFATPARSDPKFAGVYIDGIDTNIYFYPGKGSWNGVDGTIPPVLGVFNESVGIQTYNPISELHVNGTITFTNELQLYNPNTNQTNTIGLWVSENYSNPVSFSGLKYANTTAPYVGINVPPEYGIGVTLGSNLKVYGNIVDATNSRVAYWYDGTDSNTVNMSQATAPTSNGIIYTWNNTGIGVKQPKGELEIKNNYGNVTTLRLIPNDNVQQTSIEMFGLSGTWKTFTDNTTQRIDFGYDTTNVPLQPVASNIPRPLAMQWNSAYQMPQTFVGYPLDPIISSNLDPTSTLLVNGNVSVDGDVRITGNYYADGAIAFNYNSNVFNANLGVDDVYIGGGNVVLNPNGKNSIVIGDPTSANEVINQPGSAMLRVYQSQNNPYLAEFNTTLSQGLIRLSSSITHKQVLFGILDQRNISQARSPFAFMDEQNQPYLAFNTALDGTANNYVGFNTWSPQAVLHVSSRGVGSNLFKLTTLVADQSTTSACPQVTFEKAFANNVPSTVWGLAGPNSTYLEKLSLVYSDASMPTNNELFTFTNNGYIGIGNTTPNYAVDIAEETTMGGLRIANTGLNATPQIVLEAQDPSYSNNMLTSYRMYTNSNNFYLESDGNELLQIVHVNDTGRVGIGTAAASNFNLNVEGVFNVTSAICLNGVPLFSTNESLSQENAYLRAVNVYLIPNVPSQGGVCVNVPTSVVTHNLFYIAAGNDANMMVYDSPYNEIETHYRTLALDGVTYNMWRIGVDEDALYMELWQDCGCNLTVDATHDSYNRAFTIAADPSASTFTATINGSLNLPNASSTISLGNSTLSTDINNGLDISAAGINLTSINTLCNIVNYIGNTGLVCGCVDMYGHVGIGTKSPRGSLDIASGQVLGSSGTVRVPTYSFALNKGSGTYLSSNASSVFMSANGSIAASFHDTSNNANPYALATPSLSVTGTTALQNVVTVSSNMLGVFTSAPAYPIHFNSNVIVNGIVAPQFTSNSAIGSASNRWNYGYFSNIDINGARLSNTFAGELWTNVGISTPHVYIAGSVPGTSLIASSNAAAAPISISGTGLAFSTSSNKLFYPVASYSNSYGEFETAISSLKLRTRYSDPLTAYTISGSNIAAFHSATQSNALVIQSTGYVGIGTSAPTSPLMVMGSNTSNYTFQVSNGFGGGLASITQPNMVSDAGLYVSSNAYVGIGTTYASYPLHVQGQAYVQSNIICMSNVYVNNDLIVNGNTYTHFDQIVDSDRRLKSNLVKITDALDKICTLTGYTYDMDAKRGTGLIAQDVLEVLPEAVGSNTRTGYYGVEYGSMMGLVIQAIKELREEVEQLKASR
jgi:Chaperone of endosialidase